MRRTPGRGDPPSPTLRLFVVGLLLVALLPGIRGPVLEATEHTAGSLDASFDDDGVAITEISSIVEPVDAGVQLVGGDERLLVLDSHGPTDDRVWRFLPGDGALDTSFGDVGLVVLEGLPFLPRRLAVGPDGGFVVGGFTSFGANRGVRVARFLADGRPDTAFGTGGVATVLSGSEPATGSCAGTDLARTFTGLSDIGVQSDGAIVVVGPGQVGWDLGGASCEPTEVLGLVVARFGTDGSLDRVRGDAPCSGLTELADPRSMTIAPDDRVFVSTAFQCIEGPDPITVFRFSADLDTHVGFTASPEHPTDDRRLPIVLPPETTTVAVAARDPDGGVAAWNLLRWDDTGGSFTALTSAPFPPGVSSADVLDMTVADDGSYVMAGHAVLGAERPSLAFATFGPDGTSPPAGPDVVAHPGPPDTATAGVAALPLTDGTFRVVGRAEPEVFGLDDHRQVMLARLDGSGTFDGGFGPAENGFAQHHGRSGDAGEAVAVLPDGGIVAAGGIRPPPQGEMPPTGFVLRHREDGSLDPGFAPEDLAGIEITRYPSPPGSGSSTAGLTSPAGVRAASTADATVNAALAQAAETTAVATEAELRAAFSDPAETHITLTADIALADCEDVVRSSGTDLVLDGAGHTITQTCEGHRILTVGDDATEEPTGGLLTLTDLTLTGGDEPDRSGGAVWTTGALSLLRSTVADNAALFAGGVAANSDLTVRDSSFLRNAARSGGAVAALLGDGNVSVTGSTFEGNSAGTGPGGAIVTFDRSVSVTASTFTGNAAGGGGGAIASTSTGAVTVTGSTFVGNRAIGAGGGAIRVDEGDVTVTASLFDANVVVATATLDGAGGAIASLGTVTLDGSVVRGGRARSGGAAFADRILVTDSTFSDNVAREGGALWATDVAVVSGSTFVGNSADLGGAILIEGGDLAAVNSTFTGNTADVEGEGSAIRASENVDLTYVTVTENSGPNQVRTRFGDLVSFGSVIAAAVDGEDCSLDEGTTTSTYSVDTDGTCGFTGEGDATVAFAGLGSLGDNGGRTQTIAPFQSSPLVNAIPPATCSAADVTVDQRGEARPMGPACDIGAVEVFGPALDIEVEGLDVNSRGRYVIAGPSDFGFRGGVVHRLLPSGGSDPEFNGGVPAVFDLGDETFFHDVTVDASDRIVAVGEATTFDSGTTTSEIVVVRLRADGTPDPAFGASGIVRLEPSDPSGWFASGRGITIDDADRIVITGWSPSAPGSSDRHLLVARFAPSGALDASFGSLASPYGPGVALGPVDHEGEDVTTRGADVLVAGTRAVSIPGTIPLIDRDGFVAQLTGTGQLDAAFGTSGIALPFAGASTGSSVARGLALDAVGNIVVAGGSVATTPGAAVDLLVARLLATSAPDPVFGATGLVTTDTGSAAGEQAHDVAIAPDGRIVVTGHVEDDRGSRVLTARYNPGVTTLDCLPDVLDLGGRQLGNTNSGGITCTATGGTAVVTDLSVDPSPGFPADFDLTPGTCQDATLFPGESCDLTISFTPTSAGLHSATLNVRYRTVTGPRTEPVGLTGRGVPAPTPGEPGFLATPDPLTFAERIVGTASAPRTVTVTNVGDVPLGISGLTVVGPRASDFTVTENGCDSSALSGGSLDPAGTCLVRVVFTPGPGGGPTRGAQLRFVDTAPGSPHVVALRGTVTSPTLELDPAEGPVGTEVTATGTGFQPGVDVEIRLRGATVATVPGETVTVDGFTGTFAIPEGTPGGAQDVRACQACDTPSQVQATAPFTVTPRLFVVPSVSRPGGVVRARGDGFPADTPVTLVWDPGLGQVVVISDGAGEFTVPVLVFRRDRLGPRDLQARISGGEDVVATAPLLAAPGSTQPGDFAVRR